MTDPDIGKSNISNISIKTAHWLTSGADANILICVIKRSCLHHSASDCIAC